MQDVIIIGGGPAGSALGCYLSKAGIKNTIIESSNHPRPHVGESLVTSTMIIFQELGLREVLEETGFVKKYGASWHAPGGREVSIEFKEFPHDGLDVHFTYHVDRSKFDHLLLKKAEELGSKVIQGVPVKKVLFEDDTAVGVRISAAGEEIDIRSKLVVDASGRQTLLGRQLKLKKKDPIFNQYALHAWFKDVDRGKSPSDEYIHIYFLNIERGWVWQIPITDDITSMGIVVEKEFFKEANSDPEEFFNRYIETNPDLIRAMKPAKRINEFKAEGDYSYSMSRLSGNGYLLVGDAARFVDPIFSSGVSVALFCAKYAAENIVTAFENETFDAAALYPYEVKIRSGVEIWYEFIKSYYKLLPAFTHFVQSEEYRHDILRLLQGLVFSREEVPVLAAMREYIETVENTEGHLLKEQLTKIPFD